MFDFNEYQRQFPNDGDKAETAGSHLHLSLSRFRHIPRLICADGFEMSAQASEFHHCFPAVTDAAFYDTVEVGFPSEAQEELMPFIEGDDDKPTETVYDDVPVAIINALVNKHGGLKV